MKSKTNHVICFLVTVCAAFLISPALLYANAFEQDDYAAFWQSCAEMIDDNWSDNYVGEITFSAMGTESMTVDGIAQVMDSGTQEALHRENGVTYVPVRALVEASGGQLEYDAEQRILYIAEDDFNIAVPMNEASMIVNGESVSLSDAPIIRNNRIMMPLQALSEQLGYQIKTESGTIRLTRDFQTKRLIVQGGEAASFQGLHAEEILAGPEGIHMLQFGSMEDAENAYNRLKFQNDILQVEPDRYIPPIMTAMTHETETSEWWMTVQSANGWGAERIGAASYAAYLQGEGLTREIKVAVVDTGVDSRHSLLKNRILPGVNTINGGNNYFDDYYHGTHVSGIIVDCTPGLDNIKILPIKALGSNGNGTIASVANGIMYAVQNGADVINLSLGGGRGHTDEKYLDSVIEKALAKNITVVASAGNNSDNAGNYCPSHLSSIIVVGASDKSDLHAEFSNYGSSVDISAPGVAVRSSVPNGQYALCDGTSMATPHVTAAAAMLKLKDASLTPVQVEKDLKAYADYQGDTSYYGAGILNLHNAPRDNNKGDNPPVVREVVSYRWNTSEVNLDIGQGNITKDIQLTAYYSDGSSRDVTEEVGLFMADTAVAVLSVNGRITAKSVGNTYVQYSYLPNSVGVPSILPVYVTNTADTSTEPNPTPPPTGTIPTPTITGYHWNVNSVDLSLPGYTTATVRLMADYADGSTRDVTAEAGLYASDEDIAVVFGGTVTAVSAGSTYISYTFLPQVVNAPSALPVNVTGTITPARLERLEWSKEDIRLIMGQSDQIRLYGYFSDGSQKDVTAESALYSLNEGIVAVDREGRIYAMGIGQTSIYFGLVENAGVIVPRLLSVEVTGMDDMGYGNAINP